MTAVRVWVASLRVPSPVLEALVDSLGPAELAWADRYHRPDHARRYSVARGWLRHVLGAELSTSPADVAIVDGPGKPRLEDRAGPCFNVSHAGELVLIAVADREVGIDVEHRDSGRRALDAKQVACSPAEAAALDRLPPDARADAFLRMWTAKEAYLKGRGVGLTVAPDRVEVDPAAPGNPAPVRITGEAAPTGWWVRELWPERGYVGAVAAKGPDWEISLQGANALGLATPVRSLSAGRPQRQPSGQGTATPSARAT